MPLYSIPVVLPYRVHSDEHAPVYSLHVDTVASDKKVALNTAKALAKAMSMLRYGELPCEIMTERAMVGSPQGQVIGPYIYVFTKSQRIPHLCFPPRLDGDSAHTITGSLEGLEPQLINGLIMDCAPMTSIDSSSMGILAKYAGPKNMHLFRVPEPIMKILTLVGLHTVLPIHSDIGSALDAMIQTQQARLDEQE